MSELSTRGALRRHFLPLTAAWSIAWIAGLSSLTWIALQLYSEKSAAQLEAEMELYGMAVYGMAWFDESGAFHDRWLAKEPLMLETEFDLWVVRPGANGLTYYLRPTPQRYAEPDFPALEDPVMGRAEERWEIERPDSADEQLVLAIPTFSESGDEQPVAIIAVVAPTSAIRKAVQRFRERLMFGVLLLGLAGLGVGAALSWWSLRPAIDSLRQREKFLSGAAHELRTPLAMLRSIVDGARGGAEPAGTAIERIDPILDDTAHLVSDLLLFARLDSGHEAIRRERLRLDLLVEASVPESLHERLQVQLPPIEVLADPRLAEVAIRNLLTNAAQHGGPEGILRILPAPAGIAILDEGPGFRPEILTASRQGDFRFLPSTGGIGAGLALVQLIARLHGGRLELSNRDSGGARAELSLGP